MDSQEPFINQVNDESPDSGGDSSRGTMARFDSYEQIQDALRPELAARMTRLWKAVEPYVDGTFGEVDPRHAVVAVQLIKELGRLYRVYDRPPVVVEGYTEEQVQQRVDEAVAAAVTQARLEWEQQRQVEAAEARKMILGSLRPEPGLDSP